MLRHTLLIAAASVALAMPANAETKSYDMDSFNKLSVSAGASVKGHARQSVSGSASSGASIKVVGGAPHVDVSKSSGGSVSVS